MGTKSLSFRRLRFRRLPLSIILFVASVYVLDYLGFFLRLQEESLDENVHFAKLARGQDLKSVVEEIISDRKRIDDFMQFKPGSLNRVLDEKESRRRVHMTKSAGHKCLNSHHNNNSSSYLEPLRLVIIVKSALNNIEKRRAIRRTWGHEKRFADVTVRTVFLLGKGKLDEKELELNDVVQGDFVDHYRNNTLKTLMGLRWAAEICPKARFYLFVDDDYYVSLRNLLSFVRDPVHYPRHDTPLVNLDLPEYALLFAGYVFSTARPLRNRNSKWFVSLNDYKFNQYPPYIGGGAFVLSNPALKQLFVASNFVDLFLFDDIYMGILAREVRMEVFHSEQFLIDKRHGAAPALYRDAIASHGFSDHEQMSRFWLRQKELGHA